MAHFEKEVKHPLRERKHIWISKTHLTPEVKHKKGDTMNDKEHGNNITAREMRRKMIKGLNEDVRQIIMDSIKEAADAGDTSCKFDVPAYTECNRAYIVWLENLGYMVRNGWIWWEA